jgi:hypothetical protein
MAVLFKKALLLCTTGAKHSSPTQPVSAGHQTTAWVYSPGMDPVIRRSPPAGRRAADRFSPMLMATMVLVTMGMLNNRHRKLSDANEYTDSLSALMVRKSGTFTTLLLSQPELVMVTGTQWRKRSTGTLTALPTLEPQ